MKREKISGVYKIENKINGKIYIGQSVDIYDRWYEHIRDCNNGKHKNKYLQRSWIKYGCNSFDFSIVEKCSKENLCAREIYYIKLFDSYNNGYNLTKGGDGTLGRFHSEETKRKISESNKGKTCSNIKQLKEINHTNKRKIMQISLDGRVINVWDSLLDIVNHYNKDIRRAITGCCNREPKRLTSLGYIWMWKDEYDKVGLDLSYYHNNNSKNKGRDIYCKEINMKFKKIDDICNYFYNELNISLNKKCIGNVLLKSNRRYNGYSFQYI